VNCRRHTHVKGTSIELEAVAPNQVDAFETSLAKKQWSIFYFITLTLLSQLEIIVAKKKIIQLYPSSMQNANLNGSYFIN